MMKWVLMVLQEPAYFSRECIIGKDLNQLFRIYIQQYRTHQQRSKQIVKYVSLHFCVPTTPMQLTSMDLTGEFDCKSSRLYIFYTLKV